MASVSVLRFVNSSETAGGCIREFVFFLHVNQMSQLYWKLSILDFTDAHFNETKKVEIIAF